MKNLLYRLLQYYIRIGLFFYFQEVRISGLGDVPWDRPLLLLSNHQNALIDPLVIAAYAPNKPYFLTRADVFANKFLKSLFNFLRMLPIYRMRDGRSSLSKNREIFDRCSQLLKNSQTILIFPEANHSLKRRVRPLSKGFTRILVHTLEQYPGLQPLLLPVGVNYKRAAGFPDSVAFYFGHPIVAADWYNPGDRRESAMYLTSEVQLQLQQLTTHIPIGVDDTAMESYLLDKKADFLNPMMVNALIGYGLKAGTPGHMPAKNWGLLIWDALFTLLNWPVVLLWRTLVKPVVKEPEFYATHRFLLALICYPPGYLLALFILSKATDIGLTFLLLGGHMIFNLFYVKFR